MVFAALLSLALCAATGCANGSPTDSCYKCADPPNDTICIACLKDLRLINGACVDSSNANYSKCVPDSSNGYTICSSCTDDFYLDSLFFGCFSCHSSCSTCSGPSHFDCLTCRVGELESSPPSACPCDLQLTNCNSCGSDNNVIYCKICATNYLPINGKCVDSNDSTYKFCIPDEYHPTSCASCTGPYYYDPNTYSCFECHETCLTCKGPGPMECLTCPTGGVSADGTCAVPVCKMNDATNTVYHCNNCGNDNNCATCANGYYLASVRKYKLCRPCSPLCKTCANENEDECIECAVGKATPEKACTPPTCTTTNGQVGGTNDNCIQCSTDKINCVECKDGYFLEKVGAYDVCTKCHSTCYTCFGPLETDCLLCTTYASADGHCTDPVCKINDPTNTNYNCATCDSNGKSCSRCKDGYHVTTRSSVQVCERCNNMENCIDCDMTGATCTKCAVGYGLSDGKCLPCPPMEGCITCKGTLSECETCDQLYYLNTQKKCQRCYKTCLTCTASNNNECTTCISDGAAPTGGKTCPEPVCNESYGCQICATANSCRACKEEGYYKVTFGDYSLCRPCHASCFSCNGPGASDCLSCPLGDPIAGTCATPRCNNHHDDNNKNCVECTTDKSGNCTKCLDGYFKVTRAKFEVCQACHGSCKTCVGSEEGKCTSCINSKSSASSSQPGICLVPICTKNEDGCLSCTSDGASCSVCNVGYYLQQIGFYSVCTKCPDTHKCLSCSQLWWCNSGVLCDTCPDGMTLQEDCKCAKSTISTSTNCPSEPQYANCRYCNTQASGAHCTACASGYYNGDGNLCEHKCPRGCVECRSETFCTECYRGAYAGAYGMPCHSTCNSSEALVLGSTALEDRCVPCHPACVSCTGPEEADCVACSLNTYKSDEPGCHLCHTQCLTCSGPTEDYCLSCNTSYYMLNGMCVLADECLSNDSYYISGNVCRMCIQTMEGCVTCQAGSEDTMVCLRCGAGYTTVTNNGTIVACVSTKMSTAKFVVLGAALAISFAGGSSIALYFIIRRLLQ